MEDETKVKAEAKTAETKTPAAKAAKKAQQLITGLIKSKTTSAAEGVQLDELFATHFAHEYVGMERSEKLRQAVVIDSLSIGCGCGNSGKTKTVNIHPVRATTTGLWQYFNGSSQKQVDFMCLTVGRSFILSSLWHLDILRWIGVRTDFHAWFLFAELESKTEVKSKSALELASFGLATCDTLQSSDLSNVKTCIQLLIALSARAVLQPACAYEQCHLGALVFERTAETVRIIQANLGGRRKKVSTSPKTLPALLSSRAESEESAQWLMIQKTLKTDRQKVEMMWASFRSAVVDGTLSSRFYSAQRLDDIGAAMRLIF